MTQVEVTLKDGSKHLVQYNGTFDEFKELVRYDNGSHFFETENNYYILTKFIMYFVKRG